MASKYGVSPSGGGGRGGFRIIVTGDKELAQALGQLGRAGSEAAKWVLQRTAARMVARARREAPDDEDTASADLKASIRYTRGTILKSGNVVVTVLAGGKPLEASLARGKHRMNVYAIVQHEDLTLRHKSGGAKYLERPVFQIAPEIPGELESEFLDLAKGIL